MDDDDEDDVDIHVSWVQHPFTRRARRTIEEQKQGLLLELLGACERSSDACVSAALARYTQTDKHLELFSARRPT